jgi:hypothetical protein
MTEFAANPSNGATLFHVETVLPSLLRLAKETHIVASDSLDLEKSAKLAGQSLADASNAV